MSTNRRAFIQKISLSSLSLIGFYKLGYSKQTKQNSKHLSIKNFKDRYFPLDTLKVKISNGYKLTVYDGADTSYHTSNKQEDFSFPIGGSLGTHTMVLFNKHDEIIDHLSFQVYTETSIKDEDNEFRELSKMLEYTMRSSSYGVARAVRMNGDTFQYFSSWMQDHMYVMQGMKYFSPDLKSGVDLYTLGQREDGMLHDNYKHAYDKNGPWSRRFDYGNFVKVPEDPTSSCIYVRVPVENIAEFTYIEMVYKTWQATGDDHWMLSKLDSMLKAVDYATSDKYRWSDKYQLLKRGYTIDIWDFQAEKDTQISGNDTMRVYPDKTRFGIMYGDNVRFAESCQYLAKMLDIGNRKDESRKISELGSDIKERIDKLSWNGKFYIHHIPAEPGYERDFGNTDTKKQVTLSNAWALSHGVTHAQAKAIIKTYMGIREVMPESSPGEWYCCYPPFEKGFSHKAWNYMNGGVSPIAAGQLVYGAFENGFETYGVDILRRIASLAKKTNNILQGCYKGKMPEEPKRSFDTINIKHIANCDTHGDTINGVPGWTNEGENDLHEFPLNQKYFEGIPFVFPDRAKNNYKVCLGLSGDKDYKRNEELKINKKTESVYFLHTMGKGKQAGNVTLHYEDGTHFTKYIYSGKQIGNWWQPSAPEPRKGIPKLRVAWTGKNKYAYRIGVYVYGLNNPHPDKKITHIEFEGMKNDTKWMVLGVTLCDAPVYFRPTIVSTIPKHWAAAECYFGLMEGLAGIQDKLKTYQETKLAPKWLFTGKKEVEVSAVYPASQGYITYKYKQKTPNTYSLLFTGSANSYEVMLPLPDKHTSIKNCTLNGKQTDYKVKKIQNSAYIQLFIKSKSAYNLQFTV